MEDRPDISADPETKETKPVKPAKTVKKAPAVAPQWPVQINAYGDVHLKKAMIASAMHFAGIGPETEMKMTFEKGKIILTPE